MSPHKMYVTYLASDVGKTLKQVAVKGFGTIVLRLVARFLGGTIRVPCGLPYQRFFASQGSLVKIYN
ncbi:hypothetical protein PGTUg99_031475 [Puccinia graminis f. sp. tritici]|uniref:Uncharacterized protein n=1 Tax=Puccinia graminis f. sp. tritici TaxID=56615 RepID=A0A5B0RZX7_PUCGR|nr:hypothetical protein PGTUg99_031475 [Puccinia graminis f. sp. tritici]